MYKLSRTNPGETRERVQTLEKELQGKCELWETRHTTIENEVKVKAEQWETRHAAVEIEMKVNGEAWETRQAALEEENRDLAQRLAHSELTNKRLAQRMHDLEQLVLRHSSVQRSFEASDSGSIADKSRDPVAKKRSSTESVGSDDSPQRTRSRKRTRRADDGSSDTEESPYLHSDNEALTAPPEQAERARRSLKVNSPKILRSQRSKRGS